MFLRHVIVFSFIALLAGCAGFGAANPSRATATRLSGATQTAAGRLDGWQIDGKVGIRAPKDSGSGTLFWLQRQDYYDIRLSGPLGRGAARLTGRPGKVSLEVANQGRYEAEPGSAAGRTTGLEAAGVASGLVGSRPARPRQQSRLTLDGDSRLASLEQDGWQVEYLSYTDRTATGCPSASSCTAPTSTSRW
jgi:outer membrane lipoprotein LolB